MDIIVILQSESAKKLCNMYKTIVNNQYEHGIQPQDFELLDIVMLEEGVFHIIDNNRSYTARLVRTDWENKTIVLRINGQDYEVLLKDKMDLLLESMGIGTKNTTKADVLKAQMPGLILSIPVAVGDTVVKGQTLLILEAMKMENVLTAPHDGLIQSIEVTKGQAVEKNAVLIKFA